MATITSKKYSLNLRDWLRGFLATIIGAALPSLTIIVNTGRIPTVEEFKAIGIIALSAGLLYLTNQFVAPQKIIKKVVPVVILFAMLSFLPGCAVYNEFQKHCVVTGDVDVNEPSFRTCLQCDSLAKAIKNLSQKQLKK